MPNPIGTITLWSGALIDIPAGWQLCDGTNGTPDLRSNFVRGAGGVVAVGETGGFNNHTHTFTGDGHQHPPGGTINSTDAGPIQKWDGSLDSDTGNAEGTTDTGPSFPPYHGLGYIQRMS